MMNKRIFLLLSLTVFYLDAGKFTISVNQKDTLEQELKSKGYEAYLAQGSLFDGIEGAQLDAEELKDRVHRSANELKGKLFNDENSQMIGTSGGQGIINGTLSRELWQLLRLTSPENQENVFLILSEPYQAQTDVKEMREEIVAKRARFMKQ